MQLQRNNKTYIWDSTRQMWLDDSEDTLNSEKIVNLTDVFVDFEHVHIEGNKNNRYQFKHDVDISSFQYTVVESKTDTLGGKYPFIRRNGDSYYKQFPISGIITHFNENDYPDEYMGDNIMKTASNSNGEEPLKDYFNKRIEERVANKSIDLKKKFDNYYYKNHSLNGYTDYLLEREYRNDAINYLYENKVRLFRSATEGNILVKLMNITLTPNEQLDRRVYSMQCTAFEVDDFSIENCIKYGIWDNNQDIIEDKTQSTEIIYKVGQIQYDKAANTNSQKLLVETDFYRDIETDLKNSVARFSSFNKIVELKVNYYSNPSYFGQVDKQVVLLKPTTNRKGYIVEEGTVSIKSAPVTEILLAGHGTIINGNKIIIPPQVHYELTDKDTAITRLSNYRLKNEPLKCLIDYIAQCTVFLSDYHLRTRQASYQYYKVGQIQNVSSTNDIVQQIKNKHNKSISDTKGNSDITVIGVPYISIEAEPYTTLLIRDSKDERDYLHIVNDTGILTFYEKDTFIEQLYVHPRAQISSARLPYPDTLETFLNKEHVIADRNEIVYSNDYALEDTLINYICLIRETVYI